MPKEVNQITREIVKNHLEKISNFKDVYDLFRLLNYPDEIIYPSPTRRKKDSFNFKKEDQDRIKEVYSIISIGEGLSKGDNLQVFFVECNSISTRFTREVTKKLAESYRSLLVIFTDNYDNIVFILPENVKERDVFKLKLTRLHAIKSDLYYTDIDIVSRLLYEQENSWRFIFKKWKDAFSVERVQDSFFEDYKKVFFKVRDYLREQKVPKKESHEFTLQLLNRIMFIYFISKKGWLKEKKFISYLWKEYKKSNEKDTFYSKWLKQIFFKAFNGRAAEISEISESMRQLLLEYAPHLNGGLFRESKLDKHESLKNLVLPDSLFLELIQGFFERYNFTIKEDIPLDQDVAVDPQMIGYVYESLANVADEIYDRNDLGIFYTPSIEVEFMCKRSLVEYIWNNMPDILPKEKIYHLLFDLPDLDEDLIDYFNSNNIWHRLEEVLDNLSVVDPACGSGAFLVGMLNILSEVYSYIHIQSSRNIPDFERKYRIIQRNLYGVDVMPWALHAAELRLWLQLIVESDFKTEELKKGPLLPNLDMNLRRGDSLVQEIGDMTFNLRQNILNPILKKRLDKLKLEKQKYFESSRTGRFRRSDEIRNEEISIFQEIIAQRIEAVENKIKENNDKLLKSKKSEQTFLVERPKSKIQLEIEEEKKEGILQKQITDLKQEIHILNELNKKLLNPEEKPFVWDIDFAEIFGDKGGFDIVIGNPPYVRYQKISPPNIPKSEVSLEAKKEYKEKLINSVNNQFPLIQSLDRKSDYYIYFYFHGLSLLNKKGTFCFITSNSWLDVEYGRDLQEFLVKYVPIYSIYDNLVKKSFAHADVNTIIAFFGSPKIKIENLTEWLFEEEKNKGTWPYINNIAKFVMFKKPFEECLMIDNLLEIEKCQNTKVTNDMRVVCISQKELFQQGLTNKNIYYGTMWGGRYLRSPDIFLDIQKNSREKLTRLSDIINVETYLNTLGSDKFFFVSVEQTVNNLCKIKSRIDGSTFEIEKEFLTDFIESPKELKSILVKEPFKTKLFRVPKEISLSDLKSSKAYRYISFGEKNKYKTDLPKQAYYGSKIIMACYQGASHIINYNPNRIISHRFFRIIPRTKEIDEETLILLLNSTFSSLSLEIFRNPSLGGGVLAHGTYTIKEFIIPKIEKIEINKKKFIYREIKPIFEEIGIDPTKTIRDQFPKPIPEREELDDIIFDELGLTKEERNEVYWSLCELVKQRLDKAKSLKCE